MYELKSVKGFKGHEGEPLQQGNLYLGKKKICEWTEDAHGGPFNARIYDAADEKAFAEYARKELLVGKKGLVYVNGGYQELPYDAPEVPIGTLVDEGIQAMLERHMDLKDCAKGIVVRSRKGPSGTIMTSVYKAAYTAKNVAEIRAGDPDIIEVVNETLGLSYLSEKAAGAIDWASKKKACQSALVYTVNRDGKELVGSWAVPDTPANREKLKLKVPDLAKFINDYFK